MFCPKCGNQTNENSSFCQKCGAGLRTTNPSTGSSSAATQTPSRKMPPLKIILAVVVVLVVLISGVAIYSFSLHTTSDGGKFTGSSTFTPTYKFTGLEFHVINSKTSAKTSYFIASPSTIQFTNQDPCTSLNSCQIPGVTISYACNSPCTSELYNITAATSGFTIISVDVYPTSTSPLNVGSSLPAMYSSNYTLSFFLTVYGPTRSYSGPLGIDLMVN